MFQVGDTVQAITELKNRDHEIMMREGKLARVVATLERKGNIHMLEVETEPDKRVCVVNASCVRKVDAEINAMGQNFVDIGHAIGHLITQKNAKYGNSFAVIDKFFELLYPNGLRPEQYRDALLLARIFDKMMRIATDRHAFDESPYRDIAGYAMLGVSVEEKKGE